MLGSSGGRESSRIWYSSAHMVVDILSVLCLLSGIALMWAARPENGGLVGFYLLLASFVLNIVSLVVTVCHEKFFRRR